MLATSIQFPITRTASLDVALDAVRALGRQFVENHLALSDPFGFQLSPKGDHFLGEIICPCQGKDEMNRAMDILIALNMVYLRAHQSEAPLYRAGVRYDDPGVLAWYTTPLLYNRKKGDCKSLTGARVAELRVSGEDPQAKAHFKQVSRRLWHVLVQRGNGSLEDPSLKLGMREVLRRKRVEGL